MAENSKIEWCHNTMNFWTGCQKVGPPCDNCYAEGWAKRSGHVEWGPHAERRRTSATLWAQPYKWNARAAKMRRRERVFSLSLGDWLDNKVPSQWRLDMAKVIETTPHLDWLLLTKRIQNFDTLSPWVRDIPDNVWLGITCGSQPEYDRDWPILRDIPAAVRFISHEPSLGPLYVWGHTMPDWIIQGGESGHGARYMDPEWARRLRDQCRDSRIAYFFKQMTGKKPIPDDLMVRQFPTPRRLQEAA